MAKIENIDLSTNWGDVRNKLNKNFQELEDKKVEKEEGSRLITEEEADKLGKMEPQVPSNLLETDETSPSFIRGKEEFIEGILNLSNKDIDTKLEEFDAKVLSPKLLDQHNEFIVPTLDTIPNNGTLTYVVAGKEYHFKVGQLARVLVSGQYVFYQVVNISNARANWKLMGSGGGSEPSPTVDFAKGFTWLEMINPAEETPLTNLVPDRDRVILKVVEGEIVSGQANLYENLVFTPPDASDTECKWQTTNLDIDIIEGIVAGLPKVYPYIGEITATSIYDPTLVAKFSLEIEEVFLVSSVEITNAPTHLITNGPNEKKTAQLGYSIFPINHSVKDFIWVSSNPEVLSVDANGLVTALSTGVASISLYVSDGFVEVGDTVTNIQCGTAPETVVVTPTQINWDKEFDVSTHEPIPLHIDVNPPDTTWGKEIKLELSTTGVIQGITKVSNTDYLVNLSGKVGNEDIVVKVYDPTVTSVVPIEVVIPVVVTYTAIPLTNVIINPPSIDILLYGIGRTPEPVQLEVTRVPIDANENIVLTFSSTKEDVATVSENGLIVFSQVPSHIVGDSLQINVSNSNQSVNKFVPIKITVDKYP